MVNLSNSVHQGNVFLALSTLVASVIRVTNYPPLAELAFIKSLALYQYSVVSVTVCQAYINGIYSRKNISLLCYTPVVFVLYLALFFMKGYPSSKAKILKHITLYCATERGYSLGSTVQLNDEDDDKAIAIFMVTYCGSIIGAVIMAYLIWRYFKVLIKRCYAKLHGYFIALCVFLHVAPKRFITIVGVPCATTLWIFNIIWELYDLQKLRDALRESVGSAYQDAEWGFGQITVMLLWLPILHGIFLECFGMMAS